MNNKMYIFGIIGGIGIGMLLYHWICVRLYDINPHPEFNILAMILIVLSGGYRKKILNTNNQKKD